MTSVITSFDERKALFRKLADAKARVQPRPASEAGAAGRPIQGAMTASSDQSSAQEVSTARTQLKAIDDRVTAEQTGHEAAARKAAEAITTLAASFEPFEDTDGNFWIKHRGRIMAVESQHAGDEIKTAGRKISGRVVLKDTVDHVRSELRQIARLNPKQRVYRRIGMDGQDYMLDLGDDQGRVMRVTSQGDVHIELGGRVAFLKGSGATALPAPIMPASAAEAWGFVQALLPGILQQDHVPLIVAKVEHLRCDSPHTILVFLGPEGSGKTSVARRCMMAIDPFTGEVPSIALKSDAIGAAAQTRHSWLMDNISRPLGDDLENTLCRSAYGSASVVRKLFTTADSMALPLYGAWHLTGISNFIRQADTLDRALIIRVIKPSAYRTEAAIRAEFETSREQILGGLLYFLAERIKREHSIMAAQTMTHRMTDFTVTGEAITQALGWASGTFTNAMNVRRETAARDLIEGDPCNEALVKSLNEIVKTTIPTAKAGRWRTWHTIPGWSVFQDAGGRVYVITSAHALRDEICRYVNPGIAPDSARKTTGLIERTQGAMMRAGWDIKRREVNGGRNTCWVFGVPK